MTTEMTMITTMIMKATTTATSGQCPQTATLDNKNPLGYGAGVGLFTANQVKMADISITIMRKNIV